jgi:hypothetical protein
MSIPFPPNENISHEYEVYITREGSGVDAIERVATRNTYQGDVMIQGPYCGIAINTCLINELVTMDITEGCEVGIDHTTIEVGSTFLVADAPLYWNNTTRKFSDHDTPGTTYLWGYVNQPQVAPGDNFKALKRRFWIQEPST